MPTLNAPFDPDRLARRVFVLVIVTALLFFGLVLLLTLVLPDETSHRDRFERHTSETFQVTRR